MDNQLLFFDNNQLKEFQCPVCLKYFSRKFTLDMHLLIHKGIKPHPCPFCGKCFRQKGTLMRHKALHSASNLFHCSLCNRGFRQKNVFLHHLKHRHNVSTETLDRRKYRTELKDYQSIMDTLPPFVLADSTAIASSEKHLDAMLFESFGNSVCDSSITDSLQNSSLDNQIPQSANGPDDSVNNLDITDLNDISENHVFQELRYKCGLCLKFFIDYSKYRQHIEEEHNNVEMLLDSKPIICSPSSLSRDNTLTSSNLPRSNLNETMANGNFTVQSLSKTASPYKNTNKVSSSNDINSNENVNLCIPCQQSFGTEEEFECHVKTHVQSVLLGDLISSIHEQDASNLKNSHSVSRLSNSNCDISSENNSYIDSSEPHSRPFELTKGQVSSQLQLINNDAISKSESNLVGGKSEKFSSVQSRRTSFNLGMQDRFSNTVFMNTDRNKINFRLSTIQQQFSDREYKVQHNSKDKAIFHSLSSAFENALYKCKLCNKMFQEKLSFEYHKQLHLNTRGFNCGHCKKRFTSKQLLLSHTRLKHMKSFHCTSCSRSFNYRFLYLYHKQNCSKSITQVKGVKGTFNLPLVDIQKLLISDVTGILGVIPVCDKSNSKNTPFEIGIPVMSLEAMKNISTIPFLKSFEINGTLK